MCDDIEKTITGRFEWDKNGSLSFYPDNQKEGISPLWWNGKSPDPHHIASAVTLVSGLLWFKKIDQWKYQLTGISEGELAIPFEKLNLNILSRTE